MKYNQYKVRTQVWLYPGNAAWHFITLPEDVSEEITARFGDMKRGWGSLPVQAIIGSTLWKTSIFPDKKEKGYILPIKALVRKQEKITKGDTITVIVEIVV